MVTISEEANNFESEQHPIIEQKESIKLIKNTKGYNYECKILSLDVKKLKEITDEIEKVYHIQKEV